MTKRAGSGSAMHALLDLELGEESSSDSDFRIEDHDNGDDDCSDFTDDDDDEDGDNSNGSSSGDDDDGDGENEDGDGKKQNGGDAKPNGSINGGAVAASDADHQHPSANGSAAATAAATKLQLQQARAKEALERANAKLLATPICCACLGDRSDDTNEIVECDNCGISVHEGCYGIGDTASVSSTVSSCSTEPWFCEACKANVAQPVCELCPNKGGIFKETDVGKWVHLVCALYVPGVAFGEVDLLSSVTLFEMPYSKWGAKSCSLCEDVRFARTGVCIGCDAGMCKTYFHVTCAQAAGLLSEAHSEEVDHADPFYAHCKVHSDKALIKKRKRNYNGLRLKMNHRAAAATEGGAKKTEPASEAQLRIERKLKKHRSKYVQLKGSKQEPWVPTQKMPRLLSTSASACRKLMLKADLMDIDTAAIEFQEAQMAALADVRKKWHIPPAFSVEFIGYYLDRIVRLRDIKASLQQQTVLNQTLIDQQLSLRTAYDDQIREQAAHMERNATLRASIESLHAAIHALVPHKQLPSVEMIGRPAVVVEAPVRAASPVRNASPAAVAATAKPLAPPPARPMSVPTAAALKMGVGFPLTNLPGTHEDPNRILSTQCQMIRTATPSAPKLLAAHECGICAQRHDQHMLAKCDTCQLHYHLGCLHPPLQRHPKKSKLYGWQCSECVKSDDSDAPLNLPTGPRKSRTKYGKDGTIVPVDTPSSLLHLLDESTTPDTSVNVSAASDDGASVTAPSRAKHKGPGRPRNSTGAAAAAKRPAPPSSDCPSTDEARSTSASTAAKRKKGKKSVTVAGDDAAADTLVVAAPSLGGPPVADVVHDERANATTTTTAAAAAAASVQLEEQPIAVNGGNQDAAMPLVNGDTNGTKTADVTPSTGGKPKSAKKLKKEKQQAAAAASATPKPAFYIDQNGVLTSLPSSTPAPAAPSINHTAAAPPPVVDVEPFALSATTANGAPAENGAANDATIHNTVAMTEHELLVLHKQERRRRKELRQRLRLDEAAATAAAAAGGEPMAERSPNKEHKKKRKRRSHHDVEDPSVCANDGIPRIKIKFKALSLPGEPAAESHCFYVSADMVRPADDDYGASDSPVPPRSYKHPHSQQQQQQPPQAVATPPPPEVLTATSEPSAASVSVPAPKPTPKTPKTANKPPATPALAAATSPTPTPSSPVVAGTPRPVGRPPKPVPHRRLSVFNPKKFTAAVNKALKKNPSGTVAKLAAAIKGKPGDATAAAVLSPAAASLPASPAPTTTTTTAATASTAAGGASATRCDVCLGAGTAQDVVRCDECKKNYHFRCLEPPVKKTPKRRGYSWHCADCDPTDVEST